MAKYKTSQIRTLAIAGHSQSGKTMLAEAMLFKGKEIQRLGSSKDGSTVMDHDVDEREQSKSIYATLGHLSWKDREINLIDTPGFTDFLGQMVVGVSGADAVLLVVNAVRGVEVATRKAWDVAREQKRPVIIVMTHMDSDNVEAESTLEQLRSVFSPNVQPMNLPVGVGSSFSGVVDLMNLPDDVPGDVIGDPADAANTLMETIIASDEALMERYLEEEKIAAEEISGVFVQSLQSGDLVPVLFAAPEKDLGVAELLDVVANFAPDPTQIDRELEPEGEEQEPVVFHSDPEAPFRGFVFKITTDEFVGKVNFVRVIDGTLKAGDTVYRVGDGTSIRMGKLLRFQGKDTREVPEAICGDIVATAKIEGLHVGDTIGANAKLLPLKKPRYPMPMVSRAVSSETRSDEAKVAENLQRLANEDPAMRWEQVAATHQTVMYGMGEQHLRVLLNRLKRRGLEVTTAMPRIQYKETISGNADVRYRHKKQTGGAGQFAEVAIRIEPNERGGGYEFIDDIFGGAISQNFRPSVDKGIQQKMQQGIVAGHEVVDVKVTLYDGKEHPVDSKDIAFQIAGRQAIKEAVNKAKPILLEPTVQMEIAVPAQYYGDITGDISSKRGRVIGSDQMGDLNVVRCVVPLAEVQAYSSQLQAVTGGEGTFTMEPAGYDVVPSNVAQQIIAQAEMKEDEE